MRAKTHDGCRQVSHTRVLSIVPATGWVAVYASEEPNEQGYHYTTVRFPVWALVELEDAFGKHYDVRGVDLDGPEAIGAFCEDHTNFLGYAPADAVRPEEWEQAALVVLRRSK